VPNLLFISPWVIASFGGALMALAHRGDVFWALPAIMCALSLVSREGSAWRLGLAFGAMESLCIGDVWLLEPAAGLLALIGFAAYRGLVLGILETIGRRHFSPWVTGLVWVGCEMLYARVPLAVPNVVGDLLVGTPLSSLISWLGTFGAGAWLVGSLAVALRREHNFLSLGLMVLGLICGVIEQFESEKTDQDTSTGTVSMIRGGAKMEEYVQRDIAQHYLELSSKISPVELVIWPETATGMVWNRDESWMRELSNFGMTQPLLLGATRLLESGRLANGALFIDKSGVQVLDKYRQVWPIEQSYALGESGRDILTSLGRIRVLICADALDPWSVVTISSRPFELLVVLADSSRLVDSRLREMHLRRTQARALEAGTWALFVEQSETLAVINPHGEIEVIDQKLHQPGELRPELGPLNEAKSLSYWLCVWLAIGVLALMDELLRRRQTKTMSNIEQPSDSPS